MKPIDFVARQESSIVSGLIDEILSVRGQIHVAEYRLLELIRKLDELRPWKRCETPRCAHWLNLHCGIDLVTVREKMRVAHALPRLDELVRHIQTLGGKVVHISDNLAAQVKVVHILDPFQNVFQLAEGRHAP